MPHVLAGLPRALLRGSRTFNEEATEARSAGYARRDHERAWKDLRLVQASPLNIFVMIGTPW